MLANGHGGEERAVLGDEAEAALAGGDLGDVAVIEPDLAVLTKILAALTVGGIIVGLPLA